MIDDLKRAAAQAAVAEITDGMLVGLGTGSTASHAIDALAQRVRQGLMVRAVATSQRTALHAARTGLILLDMADVGRIDLCIDGVDEIDPSLRAIKGAGGAMLREKIVASAADRMIAIADGSKAVVTLGARPVPAEVLPVAHAFVAARLEALGYRPTLRRDERGEPAVTDQGNIILDCDLGAHDPAAMAAEMDGVPGLLGHGLFLREVDALYLGTADGVTRTERPD